MTAELLTGLFLNKAMVFSIDIIAVLLAVFVYKNNPKGKINRIYLVMTILMMTWINCAYIPRIVGRTYPELSLYLLKIAWFATPIFFAFLNQITSYFLGSEQKFKKLNRIVLFLGISMAFISSSRFVVSGFVFRGNLLRIEYGPLMLPFLGIILFIIIATFTQIIKNKQKFKKSNLKFFLIGLIIFYLFNGIFNILLPVFLDISRFYFFGDYSTLILLGLTAYAIVKHKLMDIRMVVARSLTYLLLLISIISIAGIFMTLLPNYIFGKEVLETYGVLIRSFVGVCLAFLFQPLRKWFTMATDRIFFKNEYNFEDLLKELTTNANATLILIELLYKTLDIIVKKMKVRRGIFILLDDQGNVYTSQSLQYTATPKFTSEDIQKLSKHESVVFDELEEKSSLKKILRRFDASLVLSLRSDEGKPTGVLILGEKESGDMYSAKDIDLFGILMPELSTAIHRAREHEKVQQFNVTLQAEVARKTKELQEANDHLQELDKAKDEFISMASHQLRTPLTAIKGYLSMLLEGDAGEIKMAQYDFVNEAFNAASRMVGLINDLLNVSRMETGRFFLEPVKVDMEVLTKEEIKQIQNHADEKKLYVKLEIKNNKLPKITADETKIRQVVMNFVDNAIYYTQKGGVTVTLDADKKNFIFKVVDTGIGVPEAQKKNLFEKFYRADNARRTRPDGTGLGIYLAKRVIEDHGGTITFDSVEGKGSTFGFLFPLKSKIKKELTIAPPDLAVAVQTSQPEPPVETPKVEAPADKEKEPASTDASLDESKRASQGGEAPAAVEAKKKVESPEKAEEIIKGNSALF